jgi:K+-sensing histidine kinase KdpD
MEVRMTLTKHAYERLLVALTIVSVSSIFALDLVLPSDTSTVALYLVPILISLLSAGHWLPLATTIVSLALATLGFLLLPSAGPLWWVAPANRALALATVTAVGCLALFYRRLVEEEKTARARQRGHAAARIEVLRGFLPICASCKNIRDDTGCWTYLETYIEARSDARFTHSLCPECQKTLCDNLLKHGRAEHDEPLLTR